MLADTPELFHSSKSRSNPHGMPFHSPFIDSERDLLNFPAVAGF